MLSMLKFLINVSLKWSIEKYYICKYFCWLWYCDSLNNINIFDI